MGRGFSTTIVCCLLSLAFASAEVRLIASSETGAELSADNYRVTLRFTPDPEMTVWSLLKNGQKEQIGSFPLQGFVRSSDDAPATNASAPEFIKASKETTRDGLLFTILYGSVGGDQHEVSSRFDQSFFSYELSVIRGHPREITDLFYLASNEKEDKIKYGKGNFEELHTWTPDL